LPLAAVFDRTASQPTSTDIEGEPFMGLHLCYELSLSNECQPARADRQIAALYAAARGLPFAEVSDLVRWHETDLAEPHRLKGLSYERLEDVVHHHARYIGEVLHGALLSGSSPGDDAANLYRSAPVPATLRRTVIGFAVAPGNGSEPASFALQRLGEPGAGSRWWWHCCCKTQYASVLGDEHLLRCHGSLVTLLDRAVDVGFDVVVRDETGFWSSRDTGELLHAVGEMNRVVARFGGAMTDAVRDAGGDSGQVGGAIFRHREFERLESDDPEA
jgi:hypothetical protein